MTLKIPSPSYWRDQICCQAACPVQTDARGYVRAIAEGEYERAYLIARGPNPLASICGRVCGAPCESACRRGAIDQPIAIRALKRFVCDRFGPGGENAPSGSLIDFLKEAAARHPARDCQGPEELLPLLQAASQGQLESEATREKSVGIIGSGPAGLAAAHDLALLGFAVTIYESESVLAGMLALGIPAYRLDRALIRSEVEVILALGVEAQLECRIGRDLSLAELRQRHDAVIVAVGCKKSRLLSIPGSDAKGVLGGVEFLRSVSLDEAEALGERVVVIGGGNVAYDVGRTVLRQTSVDAARMATRMAGVREVHLCSLESLQEMPADDIEIIEGDEEGVRRHNSVGPVEILKNEDGSVRGVVFQRCLRVFDDQRRFAPEFDPDDTLEIACDQVLLSVGQTANLDFIDSERDGLELTPRGFIACDPESGTTSAPDLFVAGDLATGPKLLIHAVASGKAVARAIFESLTQKKLVAGAMELHLALPQYGREQSFEKIRRGELRTAEPEERLTSQTRQVEIGLSEAEARREASRCLDCGINTIFDGERCVLCGGCADVCPEDCLRLVDLNSWLPGDALPEPVEGALDGYPAASASAIVKDENRCIRCALCAERCPTGAITMERFQFKETWSCLDV